MKKRQQDVKWNHVQEGFAASLVLGRRGVLAHELAAMALLVSIK